MPQSSNKSAASWLSYLPHYLAEEIIRFPHHSPLKNIRRFRAVTLFADISGFSQLSELLGKEGKAGTEKLTQLLNNYFEPIIEIIQTYGGVIVKFGGDAMTVVFPLDLADLNSTATEEAGLAEEARRALTCALAIQQVQPLPLQTQLEIEAAQPNLTLKVGLAVGNVLSATVGNPDQRLEYIIAGEGIDACVEAEHQARQGEIICHNNLLAALPTSAVKIKETRGALFSAVEALDQPATPKPLLPLTFDTTDTRLIARFSVYLHPVIAQRLKSGQLGFINEHRKVTIVFTSFSGFDYENDPQVIIRLQAYLLKVIEAVQEFGGSLAKVDMGDKGSQYIVLFGAPIAFEDSEERALRCALKLQQIAEQAGIPTQSGIHTGLVYCGQVGSALRQEYTVIGDVVNLTTRLMQAALPGQILVSEASCRAVEEGFAWEDLPPIYVKGKQEAINLSRLLGVAEQSPQDSTFYVQEVPYSLPMIGRAAELSFIGQKIEQVLAGRGQIIGISGEAGIGKSRLLAEVIKLVHQKQLTGYGGECQSYGTNIPYLAWHALWRSFFELDALYDQPPETQIAHLRQELIRLDPSFEPRLPLLEAALNLPIADNDLTASLSAKFRKEALESLLVDCLKARAKTTNLFLVLEDCHWLDPLSQDLLELVASQIGELPILLVLAYRPLEPEKVRLAHLQQLGYFSPIPLTHFSLLEAEQLVKHKLERLCPPQTRRNVQNSLVKIIVQRAEGNPFYIEELVNYLHDKQLDLTATGSLIRLELPDSLQSLILSRIDQLNETEKVTLKVASVIGRLFKASWLWGVYPLLGEPEHIKSNLRRLANLDITPLERTEPELEYLFKHIIIQDVAYESLTFATRTLLHQQVGAFIETTYGHNLTEWVDLLAYHYSRSTNEAKKKHYLRLAGQAAQATYANLAALNYYQALLPLLEGVEQLEVKLKIGNVLDLVGRWGEAFAIYEQILAESEQLKFPAYIGQAQKAMGQVLRNQGQHQEALDWWEQARLTFESTNNYTGVSQILIETGEIYAIKWELEKAKKLLNEGLQLARQLDDRQNIANSLYHLGTIANFQGTYSPAQALLEESLALRRELNDKGGIALCLNNLGNIASFRGNYSKAATYFEESLAIHRAMGSRKGIAMVLHNLGLVRTAAGNYQAAQNYFEESLAIHRETGNKLGIATVLNSQGNLTTLTGDFEQAAAFIEESQVLSIELKNKWGIALIYTNLGFLEYHRSNYNKAMEFYRESLITRRELKDSWGVAHTLTGLMGVLAARPAINSRAQLIANLGGSVKTLIDSTELALRPFFQTIYQSTLNYAQEHLGDTAFGTEFAAGAAMALETALEFTLAHEQLQPELSTAD